MLSSTTFTAEKTKNCSELFKGPVSVTSNNPERFCELYRNSKIFLPQFQTF